MRSVFYFFLFFITKIASAQVTDNFTDGDFTAAPAWSGDNADFTVVSGQLRSNSTTASYGFHLSTPSTLASNAQWEFYVNLQFPTSSANYTDIYLMSDSANLESATHSGYFVRIGNTTDEISLYKKVSGTNTEIIDGADAQTNGSNNIIKVKVTRDASNLWTLQRDMTGTGSSYFTEGTVTDATISTSSFFGIFIQQSTATFHLKHFFDDFYAGPIIVDLTPPSIVSSTVLSSTTLDVLFDENVDLTTSQALTNYSADNSLGNPSVATRDASNLSLVHLTFATPFTNALLNTLTVTNVQDLNANAITSATTTFTYFAPVVPVYRDIIINEIFADPSPVIGMPAVEWLELYNRGTNTFNLSGWKYTNGTTTATLGSYNLSPGQYLILCAVSDTSLFTPFGNTLGLPSWPALVNTGDNLVLMDNTFTVIDSVNYLDDWYRDAVKDDGGYSLELINPNAPAACASSGNWIATNDTTGGTPGVQNSVYSTAADVTAPGLISVMVIDSMHITLCFNEAIDVTQIGIAANYSIDNSIGTPTSVTVNSTFTCVDLVLATALSSSVSYVVTASNLADCSGNVLSPATIGFTYFVPAIAGFKEVILNEIFADPSPQIALPLTEFIEIRNVSTGIFNLNGWQLTDGSSTATLSNYLLNSGAYLIICPIADTASWSSFGPVMGVNSFPSLNNTGDFLQLKNAASTLIDSVTYSDDWYQDAVKDDGGWTLELINPGAPTSCPVSNNWIASTNVTGGTPGAVNSVMSSIPDVTAPTIDAVSASDSLHVTVCFSEPVDVAQIAVIGNYSISTIGNPVSITANSTYTCVDLLLATPLTSSVTYTLTVSNMSDCSGNILTGGTANFSYYVPRQYDVTINEIMADPDPVVTTLPNYEYLELYNRTNYAITMNNWTITAGTNIKVIPDVIIPADSFLVLTGTAAASLFATDVNVMAVTSFPSLTNTGQTLTLKDQFGHTISTVSYLDDWYQDDAKAEGGYSLEQIDPLNPCGGMGNWRASNDVNGGTPGKQNSIYASNLDLSAPQVQRVNVIAVDTIQLYFNESIDSTTMLSLATYTIDNGIGSPVLATPVASDFKSVRLVVSPLLVSGIIYTITVNNGIKDCAGNTIATDNTARFAIPEPVAANDLVINEILSDPNTGGVDFVEIYNRSTKVIDLKSVELSEYDTIAMVPLNPNTITSEGYLIFPGDYLVLSESGNTVKSQYTTTNPEAFLDVVNIPTMSISSGTLCLNAGTTVIDHFTYYEDMQFPLLNSTKGVTLERIDFERETNDRTNWHSAAQDVGYGTPGYKNSQYNDAQETDNAIAVTPEVFSPDEDGMNDVVSINYHFDSPGFVGNITIYDSKGRLVKYLIRNELLGTSGTFSWDGINEEREKGRIGIYIIFTEVFDLNGKVKRYKNTCVLAGKL